jgi:glycosyltransferase involved in cell wall biosynthesis
MKIAIVANSAWAAYNFRLNLAEFILREGFEVIFIIPFDYNYSEKLRENFECYNLAIDAKSLNPIKDLKILFNLIVLYSKLKPDLVCNFTIKLNIYGSLAARLCNIPSIANITGLGTVFITTSIVTFAAKWLYKFALLFPSKIFFQNNEDLNYFFEKNIISNSNVSLLPGSGVDLNKFHFSPVIIKKEKFIFLMISRVLKDKGIYEYIEAIKIIKNNYPSYLIEFQLLGEAKVNNKSAIKISELNIWVDQGLISYLGVSDEVYNVILECHCVVLPSYREGMPRSILEAFAIGRPSIVSDVPGCRSIVEHKINGLLCKVKSSEDLAKKMIEMIEFPEETRIKFAENGRYKIEKYFDEKIVIDTYLKSINEILSNEKSI